MWMGENLWRSWDWGHHVAQLQGHHCPCEWVPLSVSGALVGILNGTMKDGWNFLFLGGGVAVGGN